MAMFVRRVQDHSADGNTALGIDLTSTGFVEGEEVMVLRADALPTKAQIDRIVDAMPTVMGDVTYRRITAVGSHGIMVSDDAVHTDWLRAALYRAAGIEVTDAST